jgi:signal transduction histidine kinase
MTAPALMALGREAAAVFEQQGEKAYPEFREKGSKWFHDDTYLIVWAVDGTRVFHAADPTMEGRQARDVTDARGRPYGRMFLDVAASATGEGWVHYVFPEPGSLFPTWKSTFLKRVRSPAGKEHLIGAGIYNMPMDRAFVEDVVDRAAALVAERGKEAFAVLRDRNGPFVFMDTYVFVETLDGVARVNAGHPSLEGKNLLDVKDLTGKSVVREYIAAAQKDGSAWVEYQWYRPGQNTPARKATYVRLVKVGEEAYVVGSGYYPRD